MNEPLVPRGLVTRKLVDGRRQNDDAPPQTHCLYGFLASEDSLWTAARSSTIGDCLALLCECLPYLYLALNSAPYAEQSCRAIVCNTIRFYLRHKSLIICTNWISEFKYMQIIGYVYPMTHVSGEGLQICQAPYNDFVLP